MGLFWGLDLAARKSCRAWIAVLKVDTHLCYKSGRGLSSAWLTYHCHVGAGTRTVVVTHRARLSEGEEDTAGHARAPPIADHEAGPGHYLEGLPARPLAEMQCLRQQAHSVPAGWHRCFDMPAATPCREGRL